MTAIRKAILMIIFAILLVSQTNAATNASLSNSKPVANKSMF